jgi:hypothetical protein
MNMGYFIIVPSSKAKAADAKVNLSELFSVCFVSDILKEKCETENRPVAIAA